MVAAKHPTVGGSPTGSVLWGQAMWSRRRADERGAEPSRVVRLKDDPTLADILDDVRDLRLHLAADLSAVAGAVEEDRPSVASDFVTADRELIDEFLRRARACLSLEPPQADTPAPAAIARRRPRRLLPAAPALVAAAALVAVVSGVLPSHSVGRPGVDTRPVAESWQRFSDIAGSDASAAQVIAAADQLHESLADLIAAARHDPAKARQALRLLELERQLVLRDNPAGASVVLAQSQALLVRFAALLPTVPHTAKPATVPLVGGPTVAASASPSPARSPSHAKPKPSPSPTSGPAAPKPTPSANPAPSPSPTDFNPLPTAPSFVH